MIRRYSPPSGSLADRNGRADARGVSAHQGKQPRRALSAQPALLELGLHPVGVPRLNAERDVIDPEPRSAAPLTEFRIERVAAADDDVADLADQELVLTALVVSRLPPEQAGVKGHAL